MTVHVAKLQLVSVTATGVVKPKYNMSVSEATKANTDTRIAPNPNIPSSANWPTLEQYLILEAANSFQLVHLDQYTCITYG